MNILTRALALLARQPGDLKVDRQAMVARAGVYPGASVYQAITQPLDAVFRLIDHLANLGIRLTEFFLWFNWQDGWKWSPHQQIGTITENGERYPIWTLEKEDPFIMTKWRRIFQHCRDRSITPVLRIHDYCSIKNADRWFKRRYSWSHNVENQVEYSGGLYGHPEPSFGISRYYRMANTWLLRCLREAGLHASDVRFVPMNEADYRANDEEALLPTSYHDAKVVKLHKLYLNDLASKGVPMNNIYISTSRAFDELSRLMCPMELHGCNSDKTFKLLVRQHKLLLPSPGIFPNGDGIDPFAQGRRGDKPYKREPSLAQAKAIGKLMAKHGIDYSFFLRQADLAGGLAAMMDDLRPLRFLDAADYLVRGIIG